MKNTKQEKQSLRVQIEEEFGNKLHNAIDHVWVSS